MLDRLPSTIRVHCLAPLEEFVDDFTRIRPRYKRYVYYIQQGARPDLELSKYSWFLRKRIEPTRLQQALNFLLGTHDFEPFSQGLGMVLEGKSTTRTLYQASVTLKRNVNFCLDPAVCGSGDTVNNQAKLCDMEGKTLTHFICIELVANGFLRHMVRRIVGSLRLIGEGSQHPQEMHRILKSQVEAGPSAPAKGLWLQQIWFTDMKAIAS
uniref:tRNA pseudouridine synthase n=1 Tax=Albugo laibachii Nc14 TaxID=890382 RepID=F0W5T9_9STRA|nr:tRNA pseudouridine synthase A putative [Albugo laibachii Nc14]|eukprot:CCA16480.1 tRNA pseudouridine synthase A putative [Albugo laibachii Nc14]